MTEQHKLTEVVRRRTAALSDAEWRRRCQLEQQGSAWIVHGGDPHAPHVQRHMSKRALDRKYRLKRKKAKAAKKAATSNQSADRRPA